MTRAPNITARLVVAFPEVAAYRDTFLDRYRIFSRKPNHLDGAALANIPCAQADAMADPELRALVSKQWEEGPTT